MQFYARLLERAKKGRITVGILGETRWWGISIAHWGHSCVSDLRRREICVYRNAKCSTLCAID
jgi:hypothetical protein